MNFKIKVCIDFKRACDLQKIAGFLHYYKSAYPVFDRIKKKLIRVFGHNVFDIINLDYESVEKLCLALINAYDWRHNDNPVFEIETEDGAVFIIRELNDGAVYKLYTVGLYTGAILKPEEIKDEDFITAYNSED